MRYLIVPLVVLLAILHTPRSTPAGDNAIEDLSDRITLLEKVTLKDTSRPSETHAARIERLEKALAEDDKASEVSQKSFTALQREVETLSRRLTDLEKRLPEKRLDTAANDVKALEKELAEQERALNDPTTRVKKLESVVRP